MISTKILKGVFAVLLRNAQAVYSRLKITIPAIPDAFLSRLACIAFILCAWLFAFESFSQTTVTYNTSGVFTVPAGVTSITVECWGAGGGGGRSASNNAGRGGGGGGAYARSIIPVAFGGTYDVTVGSGGTGGNLNASQNSGGSSIFGNNLVLAVGGGGVANNSNTAGAGGLASASIGDVTRNGGNGANGNAGNSGGGGGGAGSNQAGGNASGTTAGTGGSDFGGNGGTGQTAGNSAGQTGGDYGGGGSGGRRQTTTVNGGAGASGRVVVTYTISGGSPTTYFSKASGNWNTNATWTTSPTHTGANAGPPVAGDVVVIGMNHNVSTNNSNRACLDLAIVGSGILTINQDGNTVTVSGNLTMDGTSQIQGNNANRIVNVGGNFNVPATATNARISGQQINITGATTVEGTLTFNNDTGVKTFTGNVTNSGSWTSTAITTAGNLVFNGSTDQTLSGTGTFAFGSIRLNKNGSNLLVNQNISVSQTISWASNGLLVVGANSNITLGTGGSITAPNNNRYIQLDGISSANSTLVKTTTAATSGATSWAITFPVGTATGGYTPVTIPTITTAPDNNSTLAVKIILTGDVAGKSKRTFQLTVTGNNNGTTFSNAVFSYNDGIDISSGDSEANYTTAWRTESGSSATVASTVNTGANTFTVTGGTAATATLNNGTYLYYLGAPPVQRIWYSYQTGNFNDFNTWTLDPSGTTFDNGLNLFPDNGDEIHILNGYTVTANLNNRTLVATEIQGGGTLDMAATTGHNLGTITGTGLLRIQGTTLPTGTYTDFVATTGGIIEYYNIGGTLSTTQTTYNKLRMTNSTGTNITYTLISDMIVNGTFELSTTGVGTVTWQINNNADIQRSITLRDDLTVESGGRITVGTGNENSTTQHALTMYGNITNNGIIKFYDPTDTELDESGYGVTANADNPPDPDLHRNELQGNAVAVTFAGTANNTVTCNNITDFYRFVVNKGTTQQAVLTVNSANTNYFRLFGPADLATTESGNSWEYVSANALSLVAGTLELTGNINIPFINVNYNATTGYFPIPRSAALWLNGPNVTLQISDNNTGGANKDGRILISGLLRITAGTLNDGFSKGLGSQDGGSYWQEGGTVNCWQFRPRAGSPDIFSYNQTGGVLNVGYGYALAGGKIDTYEQQYSRFDLRSPNCTFQMSGNAVLNVAKPTFNTGGGGLFRLGSDPGNYNVTGGTVNLYMGPKNANSYIGYIDTTVPLYNFNIYEEAATSETAQLQTNSLIVLNDLSINTGNSPSFVTNNLNVTVGGNFTIQTATTYTPGTGTTTFNGSGAQAWTHNGTITSLANVIVNKPTGTLTLAGSNTLPNITGATTGLTLTSGTLNDGGKTITVTSALTNNATHTSTGTGSITYSGTNAIGGNNGTFGNLIISQATGNGVVVTVATSGNQTVTGNLTLTNTGGNANSGTCLNIGNYALTVLGNINTSGTGLGVVKRIITSGLHNAGGLTRQGTAGNLLFPVGTGTLYTPNTINVTATTHGTITVRPVSSEHPNATTANQSLQYYWRVTSSGYAGITAVQHNNYTYSTATRLGTTGTYRAARFDPSDLTWATSNTTFNAAAVTAIPNFNTNTGWTGVAGSRLDGEYTCGFQTAYGAIVPYYSKGNGAWNAATGVWTDNPDHTTDNISGPPCSYCPVIIGNGTSINHTITIDDNNRSAGTLSLNAGSTLNCSTFTGLNLGTNTTGTGTLRVASNQFPSGDFLNFLGTSGGTVEWYGATKTIPATYTGPSGALNLNTYHNLILNPDGGATITLPASDLAIYNNLEQGSTAGFTGTVLTNGSRTIAVTGNFAITRGTFNFAHIPDNNAATTLTVTGSIVNNGTFSTVATTANNQRNTHSIMVSGGITNNNIMDFRSYNSGTRYNVANITFTGTNNVSFDGAGTGGTTLNLLTVNKGTSQTPTVTFSTGGTVNTTAVAGGWLTLTNGAFDFANTGTVSSDLSTNAYAIPSTARLRVSGSTVTVNTTSGDADANDLFLNGALDVAGGAVNVGNATVNGNNVDIEYAAAGTPTINISGGTLWVKSSIRRSTSTITGALAYTQTGGTVTIGGISSTENNTRGVFEIDNNTGSNFTLTGGNLNIQRQTGGAGFADVYINPVASNVSATSTITVGLTTATTQNNLRVNIVPTIGNFTVVGGTNAQTVMLYNNLAVGGNLTITSPSVLNATPIDPDANVTIGGDFIATGTAVYTGGTNTTTFNGAGAQSAVLTNTTNFYNVTVNKPSGTITVSGTAPAAPGLNNLSVLSGTLEVGNAGNPLSSTLKVNRDITINGSQTGTQAVEVYSTTGISNTITSPGGTGSFTNLTLGGNDAAARTVNVSGNLGINGALTFNANRYLMIGSSALTFGASATVSGAGTTAFVRTNGVSNDQGVIKNWASNGTFVYPVGTSSNYTPVSVSLNVSNAGTLTVVPVNSAHVTYNQNSAERILNYYWSVKRSSSLNATASGNPYLTFSYPASMLSGSGGTLVAAYLNPDPIAPAQLGWAWSPANGGSATTTQMIFNSTPATNFPLAGSYYDYSVGTEETLPNPIEPLYSRLANANVANQGVGGDWTTNGSWTTQADGLGAAYTSAFSGPRGVPLVILPGARINMDVNGRTAYRTTIDGLLYIGTSGGTPTTGHNLGGIEGTGTLRSSTNTFPAGDYTAFVSLAGGTIEYVGPMTMNNRNTYNHLSIIGTGTVTMTATNLVLNGNVNIASGATLGNAANNANMTLAGNWINNGTFVPGTGTVIFNSSAPQSITGATTFNGITVNKASGNLVLASPTTMNGALTLTSGHIISTVANMLTLNASATSTGASANSFVAGPMRKNINLGASFTFPLGSISAGYFRPASISNTSAADTWTTEYIGNNPSDQGYNHTALNLANIAKVSRFEYWNIARVGAANANVTLTYNTGSYNPPDIGNVPNLRIARWNGTLWDLPPGGGGFSQSGDNITGTVTVTNVTSFSPFTLASLDADSPLPVELDKFWAQVVQDGVDLFWETASEVNNDYFTVERSATGEGFTAIGRVNGKGTTNQRSRYTLKDTDPIYGRSYYRLRQTDFDGTFTFSKIIPVIYDGPSVATMSVYPNPVSGGTITIKIEGIDVESMPVILYDPVGREVATFVVERDSQSKALIKTITFEKPLANGLYILRAGPASFLVKRLVVSN